MKSDEGRMKTTALLPLLIRYFLIIGALALFPLVSLAQDVNSYFSTRGLFVDHILEQKISGMDRSRIMILDNRIQFQPVRINQISAGNRDEYAIINMNTLDSDVNLLGFSYKDGTVQPGSEQQFYFLSGFDGVQGVDNRLYFRVPGGTSLITFAPFRSASSVYNRIGINDTTPEHTLDINGDIRVDQRFIGFLETAEGNDLFFNATPNALTTAGNPRGVGFIGASINVVVNGAKVGGASFWSTRTLTDPAKSFIIKHPLKADHYLIHAAMEGPEAAVFYRGKSKLESGQATVQLPRYFEALTHIEGRTISLTPFGETPIMVKLHDGKVIHNGAFRVISKIDSDSSFFYWEVKAVRKDTAPLEVEPRKADSQVKGMGPYRYIESSERASQ